MNYTITIRDEDGLEISRTYSELYFLQNDRGDIGRNLYDQFHQLTNKESKF